MIDQAGLLDFARQPNFTGKNPCSLAGGYTSRPMQILDFLGIFLIVGIGLSFSLVIFLAEKFGHGARKWWRQRNAKTSENNGHVTAQRSSSHHHHQHIIQYVVPPINDLTAIDRLTEEIDKMLNQDDDYREILRDLLYVK